MSVMDIFAVRCATEPSPYDEDIRRIIGFVEPYWREVHADAVQFLGQVDRRDRGRYVDVPSQDLIDAIARVCAILQASLRRQ